MVLGNMKGDRSHNPLVHSQNLYIKTICDGLRATRVGELNRPLLDKYVDIVSTISDTSVIRAMKFLNENCGLMIEPSGAAALAGLFEHSRLLKGDTVCVISGANINENYFKELMKEGVAS